ncbi:MAG: LEA type 2 family protein [Candidatus Thiodiazotropha taylori]|nr:LEA type 2 family protein [Candidatus Thiodiazotropha taylori]MCW4311267.1 LEA type 2 family protein [Candidatus Thiodiazotropha endolucinida]MCG8109062.1 LEA type 2 family protein [Candidatus Thiodiazotropha taylori]MCG8113237.1 LEA type 2 family protein [Candidatus Thiodiazotropha taylori]MCW4281398.1 LEA type 2 family protein [Candidatus Thiodiazotropha taylori]
MHRQTIFLLFLILLFQGCSSLQQAEQLMTGVQPTGEVKGVKLSGLDLRGIDLLFDVEVDNPNPVAISLDGLDYDLKLLNRSFLKGQQSMGMSLAADGKSQVKLPVRMEFERLLEHYSELSKRDDVPYQLDLGLGIDVPLLGRVRLPMSYQGRLPVPKLPDVRVSRIDVQRLSLQAIDLMLELEVENPNRFALMLQRLDYQFKLNGIDVGQGAAAQSLNIDKQGKGRVRLPLSLDLQKAGGGLYSALMGGRGLSYELSGMLDATGDSPLIGDIKIPLDRQGSFNLDR